MRRFADAGQVGQSVGGLLGPGEWLTIDQARITAFAEATGDRQWIHIDPERAAGGPFGATVAHGYLMLSLLPIFAVNLYAFDFGSARVNYGCNRVRYPSPVRVDSRVRPSATVVDCAASAKGNLVTVRFSIEIDGDVKPALVAEALTLIVP